MALSVKQDSVKQVPWFSLTEWHEVYKQIYSNDINEQIQAYERMLAWKARIPKLPIGVDCTLSIMQICLRDREWTPKINNGELPISYENDLCLMYSTTIMKFLNHISNVGHTKQTSLFQIAKQLNIPQWIVNLRHDAAHGYELPSIGVLRIAINILLTWLHDEYWAAEAKRLEECFVNDESIKETQESEEMQTFTDLIELWTAVSLYIHVGYYLVSDIPDPQLKETLQDLHAYVSSLEQNNEDTDNDNYTNVVGNNIKKDEKYKLETARIILLSEISRYLNKKSVPNKNKVVFEALFSSEAFLPNRNVLPIFAKKTDTENILDNDLLSLDMLKFWKDILFLLNEKNMMEMLIVELLKVINDEERNKEKKLLASLWINSICYSFVKLDIAQTVSRNLEYQLEVSQKQLTQELFENKVKEETDRIYPHLRCVLWFPLSDIIPTCLTDVNFVSKIVFSANEFSIKFILPILELISPKIDEESKKLLLNLVNIYAEGSMTQDENTNEHEQIFTVTDIHNYRKEHMSEVDLEHNRLEDIEPRFLSDRTIRNLHWKLADMNYDWAGCPFGFLPWQIDTLEVLQPMKTVSPQNDISALDSEITPGVLDSKELKRQSQINWDNVLRKKKRFKRKHERRKADVIMNRALEAATNQS